MHAFNLCFFKGTWHRAQGLNACVYVVFELHHHLMYVLLCWCLVSMLLCCTMSITLCVLLCCIIIITSCLSCAIALCLCCTIALCLCCPITLCLHHHCVSTLCLILFVHCIITLCFCCVITLCLHCTIALCLCHCLVFLLHHHLVFTLRHHFVYVPSALICVYAITLWLCCTIAIASWLCCTIAFRGLFESLYTQCHHIYTSHHCQPLLFKNDTNYHHKSKQLELDHHVIPSP